MSDAIDRIIDGVLQREAGFSNDPADAGGATMHGITEEVARSCGYYGEMRDLPVDVARDIYRGLYVTRPGFDRIAAIDDALAAEVVDTGVNMGPRKAAEFLQRGLNAFNYEARYPELVVDGAVGPATLKALKAFLRWRGQTGKHVLVATLNHLQGARYIELTEAKQSQRKFAYGWISQRTMG